MAETDEELFASAYEDETPQEPAKVEETKPEPEDRPRDEHGRFAPKAEQEPPKAEEPQEVPKAETPPSDQGIPSWRLREEAEARRGAEERASRAEREAAEFRRVVQQLQEQNKPKPPTPDFFENPEAAVDHGVRRAIDPLEQNQRQTTEFYSQQFAVLKFGQDKVNAAYDAMDKAIGSRDPEAITTFNRMKASLDPFGDMVKWHQRQSVFAKVGDDPDAFVEKQLEERLKDPAYQAKLLERIRGATQASPRPQVTQLPPSLNKATSAAQIDDNGGDDSDAGLLKSALRR